jgi:hypothetical protein
MRHKFYLPIGMPTLASPPSGPVVGDTYFDTTDGLVCTWDGERWISGGGGTLTVGPGLDQSGSSMSGDITLSLNVDDGITFSGDSIVADDVYLKDNYVARSGSTMRGDLFVNNPTLPKHPVTLEHLGTVTQSIYNKELTPGNGLIGGGPIGGAVWTIAVGKGNGILVNKSDVALDWALTNSVYSNVSHSHTGFATSGHTHAYAASDHTHSYAPSTHSHAYTSAGIWAGAVGIGDVSANGTIKKRVTHNLTGKIIRAISLTVYGDSGDNGSLFASVYDTWAPNTTGTYFDMFVRNVSDAKESGVGVSIIVIYS